MESAPFRGLGCDPWTVGKRVPCLLYGFLGVSGRFWHAIMHRREPDASNAGYWFRRVGTHPIFETLAQEAQELGLVLHSGRWNPFDFIDLCEKHRGTGSEQELLLRRVQQREWELLFDWCFRRATSKE